MLEEQIDAISQVTRSSRSSNDSTARSADTVTVHILAAVAEHEAKVITERTKAALAAAKRRGVKLDGYRGTTMTKAMRKAASEAITKRAKARAADLAPTITELQADGAASLRAIAAGLNERGIPKRHRDVVSDAGHAGAGTTIVAAATNGGAIMRQWRISTE
jgi:DNA invertase Pin-like site-specific DNA recombinase